jgi:hypothetical protein
MTVQRTRTASGRQQEQPSVPAGDEASAANSLLQQAQGFAQVAQEAYRDCEHGADAERELENRRNQSGQ